MTVRAVIETLVDQGSFLELRPNFAPGVITRLIRWRAGRWG